MKSLTLSIIFICALSLLTRGQDKSDSTKHSYFKVAANYLSNAVYNGRKDSLVVPYLRPSIGYYNKSGFFVSAGISLLAGAGQSFQLDLISAEAGYDFKISDALSAGITASKYFYSDASFATASELNGGVGVNLSYDAAVVSIGSGAEVLFSNKTDIFTNVNLSHAFEFGKNNSWTFTPTFQLNAGTQYFNQAYYELRKYSVPTQNSGSGSGSGSGGTNKGRGHSYSGTTTTNVQTITFTDQNRFSVLDFELALPITYDFKNWGIFLTPHLAIPANPSSFALNGHLQKEQLSNTLFVETGVSYKFLR